MWYCDPYLYPWSKAWVSKISSQLSKELTRGTQVDHLRTRPIPTFPRYLTMPLYSYDQSQFPPPR